jgi:membrane-bound lytic murein transglycosylase B
VYSVAAATLLMAGLTGVTPPVQATAQTSVQTTAPDFSACLNTLQERAREQKLSATTIATVATMEQQQRVLELDGKQPEFVQTFGQYLNARLTDDRIRRGRELYSRHRDFLDQLTTRYGVPGQYLVAFWGLETNYGSYLGNMPTLDSLATLACDPRRGGYFTEEFLTALRVMERESLEPRQMKGSWAGAMGHTQFMPSNYLRYAVDGDGDGNIDLWGSEKDALASGANFLQHLGWVKGIRWGREVSLSDKFDYELIGRNTKRTVRDWASLNVGNADGSTLPPAEIEGSVLVPSGHRGPAFLVYDNFSVIMKWNRSESYALSVGLLADRIAGAGSLRQPPPADQKALSRAEVEKMQLALNQLGYDLGEADGVMGPATRNAVRAFQRDAGLISDGYPDRTVLEALQR